MAADAADLGLAQALSVHAAPGYLLQGGSRPRAGGLLAAELLADPVVERTRGGAAWATRSCRSRRRPPAPAARLVHVLLKPGVMDPVAPKRQQAIADFGIRVDAVRTFRKYWVEGLPDDQIERRSAPRCWPTTRSSRSWSARCCWSSCTSGSPYQFQLVTVPIRDLDDDALLASSAARGSCT